MTEQKLLYLGTILSSIKRLKENVNRIKSISVDSPEIETEIHVVLIKNCVDFTNYIKNVEVIIADLEKQFAEL